MEQLVNFEFDEAKKVKGTSSFASEVLMSNYLF